MGYGRIIAALLAVACVMPVGISHAQTLSQIVETTVLSHPDILGAKAQMRGAGHSVDAERAAGLPSINFSGSYGYEISKEPGTKARGAGEVHSTPLEGRVVASQLIFDGFETPRRIDAADYFFGSSRHSVYATAEDVGLRAVQATIDVLRQREIVALAEDNLQRHRDILRDIRRREGSVGSAADTSQAEARLALATSVLEQRRQALMDAEAIYRQVVGQSPGGLAPISVESIPNVGSVEGEIADAESNHPAIRSAQEVVKGRDALVEAARAPFYPNIRAELSSGYQEDGDGLNGESHNYLARIRVNFNLYRGGGDLAFLRRAREGSNQSRQELHSLIRDVRRDVELAHDAYVTTKARLLSRRQHMESTANVHEAYKKQFRILSQRTLLDVLDSATELFNARAAYIDERSQFAFAYFRLAASKGALLSSLGVRFAPDDEA